LAAMASSQGASAPERTTLPPSLTTTGWCASLARGTHAALCSAAAMSVSAPTAHDLDADGARVLVELLDDDTHARGARMVQTVLRHFLGQGLHEVDMAPRDDLL